MGEVRHFKCISATAAESGDSSVRNVTAVFGLYLFVCVRKVRGMLGVTVFINMGV
jgi:hypothetical protein